MVMTEVSVTGSICVEKKTKGKRKIPIEKIVEPNSRQVTFSKRRTGLFKKAAEICVLTGAQIAVVVSSPGGRAYAFRHPNTDVLVDRYINDNNEDANTTTKNSPPPLPMKEFNQHYVEVSRELEAEKKRKGTIPVTSGGIRWYDEAVDGLDVEELQQYLCSLGELKKKVLTRADELMMINKSSTFFGSNESGLMGWNNSIQPVNIPTITGGDDGLNLQYGEDFGNLY
ncbi:hypothetical protein L2E82_28823 [Cichorium intybus]|uniref:Uncharacterized protein n=1 Tax=Cichorium intybus TaxID=13427 RepID=A0ACB9CWU1_CICIN|nr:hypothetical protein L2E82_28823 [Cichorium intybus]